MQLQIFRAMINNSSFQISPEEAGARLDIIVLKHYPSTVRSIVKKAIENSSVLLNGTKAGKGVKTAAGDTVYIVSLPEAADRHVLPDPSVRPVIVYDDAVLIGADKPAGIPVQPLSPEERGTLMNGLVVYAPELLTVGDDPMMAGALHRIDTGTSGLVLASRSNSLWNSMRTLFAERKVKKTYIAMVEGAVSKPGKISCSLAHDPKFPMCRMTDASKLQGKVRPMAAETFYKPVKRIGRNTLLEVTIYTGVTHQIRAQLAMAGHPVCGDTLYGAAEIRSRQGHLLHALSVDFVHPENGAPVHISTEMPAWT